MCVSMRVKETRGAEEEKKERECVMGREGDREQRSNGLQAMQCVFEVCSTVIKASSLQYSPVPRLISVCLTTPQK